MQIAEFDALKWMAEEAAIAKLQHKQLQKTHNEAWMRGYWTGRLEQLRLQALHVYGLTENKWMELVEAANIK